MIASDTTGASTCRLLVAVMKQGHVYNRYLYLWSRRSLSFRYNINFLPSDISQAVVLHVLIDWWYTFSFFKHILYFFISIILVYYYFCISYVFFSLISLCFIAYFVYELDIK